MTYRLLVPADKYPVWEPKPISRVARVEHLYTSVLDGESDEFERR
jgi:hypothetical protein